MGRFVTMRSEIHVIIFTFAFRSAKSNFNSFANRAGRCSPGLAVFVLSSTERGAGGVTNVIRAYIFVANVDFENLLSGMTLM